MRFLLLLTLFFLSCALPQERVIANCSKPLEVKVLKITSDRGGFTDIKLLLKNCSNSTLKVFLRFSVVDRDGLVKEIPGFGFSVVKIPPKGKVEEFFRIPYPLKKGERINLGCFKLNP